jgi:hypothetical protein
MKLSQFLSALKTANVIVDLHDVTSSALIVSLRADGYSVLEDTIESREVVQWEIVGMTKIKAVLGEVIE